MTFMWKAGLISNQLNDMANEKDAIGPIRLKSQPAACRIRSKCDGCMIGGAGQALVRRRQGWRRHTLQFRSKHFQQAFSAGAVREPLLLRAGLQVGSHSFDRMCSHLGQSCLLRRSRLGPDYTIIWIAQFNSSTAVVPS